MRLPMTNETILKPWYVIQHYQEVSRDHFYISTVAIVNHWSVVTTNLAEIQNIDIAWYRIPTSPSYGMPEDKDMLIIALVVIIIILLVFIL